MDRIVRIVTKNLVSRLPSEKEFVRLDYLRSLDIPDFIVERVKVEMQRNIEDSIVLPYTEWADLKNSRVREAWDQFIEVIREESRMPYAYAPSIVENAVSDSLDMLLQPRKRIPEIIFGTDKALDRETLEERTEVIVVYKHLALAPVKYLYRKNLEAITFEQCKKIIGTVDEKLVSKYNALNWAHLFEPLFELLGDTIDTNLLRIFFEDKKRPAMAHKFDKMNSSIDRSGLIEVLSSPEMLDESEMDEDKAILYRNEEPVIEKKEEDSPEFGLDVSQLKQAVVQDEEDQPLYSRFVFDEKTTDQDLDDDEDSEDSDEDPMRKSFNEMFAELDKYKEPKEEDEIDKQAVNEVLGESAAESEADLADDRIGRLKTREKENNQQKQDVNQEKDTGQKKDVIKEAEAKQDLQKKADFPKSSKTAEEDLHPAPGDKKIANRKDESILSETEPPEEEEDDEKSIWQNFVGDEDFEDDRLEYDEDDRGEIVDISFSEEDDEDDRGEIVDFAFSEEDDEDHKGDFDYASALAKIEKEENKTFSADDLIKWLGDDADRFVEDLFNGSEQAFEDAMGSIVNLRDWKAATRYIEKEIFSRNLIDLYDEAAVDFTDRLHTFFIEFKSSKTSS